MQFLTSQKMIFFNFTYIINKIRKKREKRAFDYSIIFNLLYLRYISIRLKIIKNEIDTT